MKTFIPYNCIKQRIQLCAKCEDTPYLYIQPFKYDYLTTKEDGNVYYQCYRLFYNLLIDAVNELLPQNITLILNKESILQDDILKNFYIDKLDIKNYIVSTNQQLEQIKKYRPKASVYFLSDCTFINEEDADEWLLKMSN